MKTSQHKILMTLGLLVIAGALVFTTSCGPKKHKIDDSTVLPIKDKAELDKLLDLPILPEYTIEEYYTNKDFVYGDERFVVCCKFLEEVSPAKVQEIMNQINSGQYDRWYVDDMDENDMRLYFDLDTTLTADKKRPEFLGDHIRVEAEIRCREKDSWKGFEVVFRNNRADFNAVVDRDTLSKLLGVEFPPLTETRRSDENIYYEFDSIPGEEFYQALEKAPNWNVSKHGDMTFYYYDNDDGNVWITADVIKDETYFSFRRDKSFKMKDGVSEVVDRVLSSRKKNQKSE